MTADHRVPDAIAIASIWQALAFAHPVCEAFCPECRRVTPFPMTDPPEDSDDAVTVVCGHCASRFDTELWTPVDESEVVTA